METFKELQMEEMNEIHGGNPIVIAFGVALSAGLILSAIENWSDIKKGALDAHSMMLKNR